MYNIIKKEPNLSKNKSIGFFKNILNFVEKEESPKLKTPGSHSGGFGKRHCFFKPKKEDFIVILSLPLSQLTVHCRGISPWSFRQGPVSCFAQGLASSLSKSLSSRVHFLIGLNLCSELVLNSRTQPCPSLFHFTDADIFWQFFHARRIWDAFDRMLLFS